jgi:hypothetical protein
MIIINLGQVLAMLDSPPPCYYRQTLGIVPELGYDYSLVINFQFIIHCYSLSHIQHYKIKSCRTEHAAWFENLASAATEL